jgi:hypothetical protein
MSMLCTVFRVSREQMAELRASPERVAELLDEPPKPEQKAGGLLSRLLGRGKSPAAPEPSPRFEPVGPDDRYELDQNWHILHFLLTGQAEGGVLPGAFICSGGVELGRDLGYGPPRLFPSRETRDIAEFLGQQSPETLSLRYQAEPIDAAGIYWQTSAEEGAREQELQGLWQILRELQLFLLATAQTEGGILVEVY